MTKLITVLFELIFIKKDTLATIQALIAPVFIPLAPAVLLGSEVYKALSVDTVHWLALSAAIASAVGVEAVGGLSSYTAVLKAQRKQWGSVALASLVVIMYIAALVVAMWYFNAPALGVFAILTPSAFIIAALFNVDGVAKMEDEKEVDARIKLINAQKNLANAQARKERWQYENGHNLDMSVLSGNASGVSAGQPDSITDTGQKVIDWLNEHGDDSARNIADGAGVGKSAANEWRNYWKENLQATK